MIRLTYRDQYDSEAEWIQGFYYQNADGNPTTYGMQIPRPLACIRVREPDSRRCRSSLCASCRSACMPSG